MTLKQFVNSLLFQPPACHGYSACTDINYLPTARNHYIASTYITRPGAKSTIIFSHGNGEDLNSVYYYLLKLSIMLNVNVMAYDYAGYGLSSGKASEKNCYADIDAVYNYLVIVKKVAPQNIFLYGRSLGSGPSCYLAARISKEGHHQLGGLVLHAPFTSVYRVVLPDLGIGYMGDPFPNIDRIPEVTCPVFIAHGKNDDIIPFEHSQSLLRKVSRKSRPHFFTNVGMYHNHFEEDAEVAIFSALQHFLRSCCLTQ